MLHGNLTGLKSADLRELERLYKRKISSAVVITPEAARAVTEISARLNRQIGLLIERSGIITHIIVGDAKGIFLPDLSRDWPLGNKMLRGLRLVHTHLAGEPLSRDDLTDLALLRFDMIAAIGVGESGLPGNMRTAWLNPNVSSGGEPYEIAEEKDFHRYTLDFRAFVDSLEEEMRRAAGISRRLESGAERAILVSVSASPKWMQEDSMNELDELARSSDLAVLDHVVQRMPRTDPRYLMGRGKLDEVIIRAMQLGATIIVFDQNLTPSQGRSIADATELKVIDRSQLILDIFARRAHSREGKVQVELAQLKYRLPRLMGKGTEMSRLTGGIGGRGPGEMKLEIDRRRVRDRISLLEKDLKTIALARAQRKSKRAGAGIPIVSIAGYTNAGKSTLLNALTKSDTYVESKMFATLDTASRRLRFPRERDVIITDTVGFIRDLPPDLFNAFRATLEEMEDACLIMHVVDVGNPRFEQHIASVNTIMGELGFGDKPVLLVFNKIDQLDPDTAASLCERYDAVGVSAIHPETLPALLAAMEGKIWSNG
ncbi:MAG: GTPase HflX [Nitrospirae bacterium]|nr:GTPase HflX [Nitrospirota bacterium]